MKPEEVEALQVKAAVASARRVTEIHPAHEINRNIRLLQPVGMVLIALSLVWWITTYTKAGGIGGAWECLFVTTGACAEALARPELAGYLAYRPFLMWIGVVLWLAGVVLNPRRIEIAPLAWAAVGIPLLWAVWITIEKALVLFQ
jgi:hypothetical protein